MAAQRETAPISNREFKELLHPSEEWSLDLAMLVTIPTVSIGLIVIAKTFAAALIILAFTAMSIWLSLQLARSYLTANAIKVSHKNFPDIYELLQHAKARIGYNKKIEIYIVEEGTINAFLSHFFTTKFIVLHSELVGGAYTKSTLPQIEWVIARFVGALRAKHDRLLFFRVLFSSLESMQIFNLFLLPYERAVQYSGDQIGVAVCGDLTPAIIVLQKIMVGNELADQVNREGVLEQRQTLGIFAKISGWYSMYPHHIDRYANLLSFARERYPKWL